MKGCPQGWWQNGVSRQQDTSHLQTLSSDGSPYQELRVSGFVKGWGMIMVPSSEGLDLIGGPCLQLVAGKQAAGPGHWRSFLRDAPPVWQTGGQIGGCQSQLRDTWSGSSLWGLCFGTLGLGLCNKRFKIGRTSGILWMVRVDIFLLFLILEETVYLSQSMILAMCFSHMAFITLRQFPSTSGLLSIFFIMKRLPNYAK